jgi:hypothetical protein
MKREIVAGAPYVLWKQNLYVPPLGALNSTFSPEFPLNVYIVLPLGEVTYIHK